MDAVVEMMRRVVVFLLTASLFGNLLAGSEYRKYFSYAAGLIVMTMVLVPTIGLLGKEGDWRDFLVQADYRQKAEDREREIAILGREYEDKVEQRYEEALRTEIAALCGVRPEQCSVRMKGGKIERLYIKAETTSRPAEELIDAISLRYGAAKNNIFIEESGR